MKKLLEVEIAKELMAEAMKWSVMKWMGEKKKVRKTADQANAALDQLREAATRNWPASMRTRYEALGSNGSSPQKKESVNGHEAVSRCKQADDEANRARIIAEETFDRAERLLSTRLAREGCSQAIRSWELKEKAIRLADEIASSASSGSLCRVPHT